MMARLTLLRSVLSSLPFYLLANAAVPLTCLKKIERQFRDFLWASMQDGHGIHLLAWDIVSMPISEGGLGIQSLIVRRDALIARHATRFLLDPHCLWSSFMRGKYGDWNSSSLPQLGPGHSFFWKEVCRHAPAILDSISWSLGDGASVDIIHDTWIADLSLSRWPTFVSSDIPHGMRVIDLIGPDCSTWSSPMVSSFFGAELYRRILAIPLTPVPTPDIRVWRRSCMSRAPIRDLVEIYSPQSQHSVDLKWIWRLPIHPRVRLFMWKLAWNTLPTCSLLSGRGLSIPPTCPLCGMGDETVGHAIFRCLKARQIWQFSGDGPWDQGSESLCSYFLSIIREDMARGLHLLVSRRAYTAYHIWLSRNRLLFADETIHPRSIVRAASSSAAEYALHQRVRDSTTPGHWDSPAASAANRRTVFISWEPPPPGFVKLNFDGSVRGRCAGSAFVIRGPDGGMLAAGGFGLLDSTVPLAELSAAWAGICCAIRSLGAHSIIIEGDSSTVIRWIRQDPCARRPIIPLIGDIHSTLQGISCAMIRHIYREANSAADWIAARMASQSGSWSWKPGETCPPVLSQILYSDISGLTHPRLV